jgi:hypothetical protein
VLGDTTTMQGLGALQQAAHHAPFSWKQSHIRRRCVCVRDASLWSAGLRLLSQQQQAPVQHQQQQQQLLVQNTVQQEPQQQKLVLHGAGKKKYIPFKPDFFSSEAVQLAGACAAGRLARAGSVPASERLLLLLPQDLGMTGASTSRCPLTRAQERRASCWSWTRHSMG